MYICTAHISIIFSYIINLEKLIHKILFFIYIFTYTADFFSDYSPSGLNTNVAHQAPLSMGFSRQEHWGGLPFPPPGDLPQPKIEPDSPVSPALADRFFATVPPGNP